MPRPKVDLFPNKAVGPLINARRIEGVALNPNNDTVRVTLTRGRMTAGTYEVEEALARQELVIPLPLPPAIDQASSALLDAVETWLKSARPE